MGNKTKLTAVDAFVTLAITSLVPFMDRYPSIQDFLRLSKSDNPTDDWDFFITSACVGIILLTREEYKDEHKNIETRLNELDKNYMRAVKDLSKFMKNTSDDLDTKLATIGHWVLWNIKKAEPTTEEIQNLSLPIGNYIMNMVYNIRKEKIG